MRFSIAPIHPCQTGAITAWYRCRGRIRGFWLGLGRWQVRLEIV